MCKKFIIKGTPPCPRRRYGAVCADILPLCTFCAAERLGCRTSARVLSPVAVSPDTWASIARGTRFFNVRAAYLSRAAHTFPLGLTRRRLFERATRASDSVPNAGENAANRAFRERFPAIRLCLTNKHLEGGENSVVSLLYKLIERCYHVTVVKEKIERR